MKKYILMLLLPISVFAADNYFCPSEGALSFTENNNGTCNGSNNCHKITNGQSWNGIDTKIKSIQINKGGKTNNVKCVLIKAGQKYSDPVSVWSQENAEFKLSLYNTLPTIDPLNRNNICINGCKPTDLNFATKGTLRISGELRSLDTQNINETVDCHDVILAQGSYETPYGYGARTTINWIYSPDNSNSETGKVKLTCTSETTNKNVEVEVTQNTGKNNAEVFNYKIVD